MAVRVLEAARADKAVPVPSVQFLARLIRDLPGIAGKKGGTKPCWTAPELGAISELRNAGYLTLTPNSEGHFVLHLVDREKADKKG